MQSSLQTYLFIFNFKWHFILHEEKQQMKQEAFRSYRASLFSDKQGTVSEQ
jgi:hypothetical protein